MCASTIFSNLSVHSAIYQCIFILAIFIYSIMGYKRDYLHPSMDISFFIMFYIINAMKKVISKLPLIILILLFFLLLKFFCKYVLIKICNVSSVIHVCASAMFSNLSVHSATYQYIFILAIFIYSIMGYKRNYLHPSMGISFSNMFYIINAMRKVPTRTWFPQSTVCSYASV